MRRHHGITRTTCILLALTLVLTVALTWTAFAQTGASPGASGSSTAAGTTERPTTGQRTEETKVLKGTLAPSGPIPYNILDEADEDLFLSLLGWTSKYRIGLDVQDGDWVRYESIGDGPIETLEIRASKTDAGQTWIIETRTVAGSGKSTEFHSLYAAGKPKLIQAFRIDESGTREDITPLEDIRAGELFLEARQTVVDALGGKRNEIQVTDCGEVKEIEGPFGTKMCRCIQVLVAEDVDPISFARQRRWLSEGTLMWLNEDVPRLIPLSAVLLPSLLSPDDMMTVPGGMVRSAYHVLVDYKGRS
jgi:hypothetical protein